MFSVIEVPQFRPSYATNQNILTILTRIMNGLCFMIAQMYTQATHVLLENKVCFESYENVRKLLLSLLTPQLSHEFFAIGTLIGA